MINRRDVIVGATVLATTAGLDTAFAQQGNEIRLGAIYPFSGSGAQIGVEAKWALDTAQQIINDSYDLDLLRARDAGLPRLGGAKVRIIYADHQADPQKGRSEAERLITQEGVAGLIGTYHSSVAAVVSQVAERYQVPFIAAESSSPTLHRKGLKYFFRAGPHDELFTNAMFKFMDDLVAGGESIKSIALFYEDTLFGTDTSRIQKERAAERKLPIVADVKYRANSPSLSTEVQLLKSSNPDVVMATSYTTDAIQFIKTSSELGFRPKGIICQDAGYYEPAFLNAVGPLADGLISRATYAPDFAGDRREVQVVNDIFKKKSGKDFNDSTSREFTAVLIMAEAINRAGSAKGPAIRDALAAMDIPGEQTIMPWRRVAFGEDGQNTDVGVIMMQCKAGEYRTVWPKQYATTKLVWPIN